MIDLNGELLAAQQRMSQARPLRDRLVGGYCLPPEVIDFGWVGVDRIETSGAVYQPSAEGHPALIVPVRADAYGPEVDDPDALLCVGPRGDIE